MKSEERQSSSAISTNEEPGTVGIQGNRSTTLLGGLDMMWRKWHWGKFPVALAGCLCLASGLAFGAERPGRRPTGLLERALSGEATWVDLTHPLHEKTVSWPGGIPFKKTLLADYPQGFRMFKFEMAENVGTHVDAPAHFVQGTPTIDRIPLSRLIGPAVVVDVTDEVKQNPDYRLTREDLRAWETRFGKIPVGGIVIMRTGWGKRAGDLTRYRNMDSQKVMHFPGFSKRSAEFLTRERDISGIGIDTLSLDHGPSTDFPVHKVMLGAGKFQIENLANLDRLPGKGAIVFVMPINVKDGTQAEARVIALVP
jgi:kynurenine formamidase